MTLDQIKEEFNKLLDKFNYDEYGISDEQDRGEIWNFFLPYLQPSEHVADAGKMINTSGYSKRSKSYYTRITVPISKEVGKTYDKIIIDDFGNHEFEARFAQEEQK